MILGKVKDLGAKEGLGLVSAGPYVHQPLQTNLLQQK